MDAGRLLAFDVARRKTVKRIVGRVFASATNDHEVLTLNAPSGAVLAQAPAGEYPDGLAFDPVERRIFVSDESGGVETVLNAGGHRVATIPLGGEAGNVQYDAGSATCSSTCRRATRSR